MRLAPFVRGVAGRLGFAVVRERALRARLESDAAQIATAVPRAEGLTIPGDPHRLELLADLIGTTVAEAVFIVAGLHASMGCEGDICEFGVAQGATSVLLANELRSTQKILWLYDSFEGLPAPTEEDELIDDILRLGSMRAYRGKMAYSEEIVRKRLAGLPEPFGRYQLVKGFFENSPSTPGPESISFAYIDFDLYEPIKEALAFTDARLARGAVVVVDDYDYFSAGAKRAVDEFLVARGRDYNVSFPTPEYGHFCVLTRVS